MPTFRLLLLCLFCSAQLCTAADLHQEKLPVPELLGLDFSLPCTAAENILLSRRYRNTSMTFATPYVERVYSAPDKACGTLTLSTCSAGGMLVSITCRGEDGARILALAREKMSLKAVDNLHETQGTHYAKTFEGNVRMTLRTSRTQGELILHSPDAAKQCLRRVDDEKKVLAEKQAAADNAQKKAMDADF